MTRHLDGFLNSFHYFRKWHHLMWISVVWTEDCSSPCTSPWFVWQCTYFNPWYISEKFPSLTDNCCSHQSFTLLEDTYDAIIVIFFWPLVSLLMLLGYVACKRFFGRQIHNEKKQDKLSKGKARHERQQWCW